MRKVKLTIYQAQVLIQPIFPRINEVHGLLNAGCPPPRINKAGQVVQFKMTIDPDNPVIAVPLANRFSLGGRL